MEESDNKGVPPYRFNTKELDEETGLYYYGARYLDPTGVGWLSVDPLFEKYVGMSPYGYCAGNPVRLVDVDGREVLNGYQREYDKKKSIYDKKLLLMRNKYGERNNDLNRKSFQDKKQYKSYKKSKSDLDIAEKDFKTISIKYNTVYEYIEQYRKIDPKGFDEVNNLVYWDENITELVPFNVSIVLDDKQNLIEWGGAKSSLIENKKTGTFSGRITISSDLGTDEDGRLSHEFGHNVTNSLNPKYWITHTDSSLNCQENSNHDQAKLAIIWQNEWIKILNSYRNK